VLPVDVGLQRLGVHTRRRGKAEGGRGNEQVWEVWNCELKKKELRFDTKRHPPPSAFPFRPFPPPGFNVLSGVPSSDVERIVERGGKAVASLDDFARRTGLSRAAIARLQGRDVRVARTQSPRRPVEALGQDPEGVAAVSIRRFWTVE